MTRILREEIFKNKDKIEFKATRDAFGEAILELAQENKDIVSVNADLESSLKLSEFAKKYPDRSIQVGVAEQNMAAIGMGLALYGKIPFISSFAAFSPTLNLSQIRMAAYSYAKLKIVSTHYGVNIGEDGVSAQMLSDVAMLRSLPNLFIVTPADAIQAKALIKASVYINEVIYIRLTRGKFPLIFDSKVEHKIGKGQLLLTGRDITIVATGSMVYKSIEAAQQLKKDGIEARVINIHTVKPLDKELILAAAKETKGIVTVEEHQVIGGLGSAVAELLIQHNPIKIKIIGVDNVWGETGESIQLMDSRGLTTKNIVLESLRLLKR